MTAAVRVNPFEGMTQPFALCGNQNHLTFFTVYAPEGSPRQGLMRVSYEYDEEAQTLSLYEQVITDREGLEDKSEPFSKDWKKSMTPLSRTGEIKAFELSYGAGGMDLPLKEEDWKEEWKCDTSEWPGMIRLRFQTGEGPRSRAGAWTFRPGIMGLQAKETLTTRGEAGPGEEGTQESIGTSKGVAEDAGTVGRGATSKGGQRDAGRLRGRDAGTRDRSRRLP
jgi:hypothetical protein